MTDFIVIGNSNLLVAKDVFPLFKDGRVRFGNNYVKEFVTHCGDLKNLGNVCWYTTFPVHRKPLVLTQRYDPEKYPKYDNFGAINVDMVKDIPYDYEGVMGVPISFLHKYNPEQFELLGHEHDIDGKGGSINQFEINGKGVYARILIRKRNEK